MPTQTPLLTEVRHLPGPGETAAMDTTALRRAFLLEDLFEPGELRMVRTDLDRMSAGAAMPRDPLLLPAFRQRQELGIVNLGRPAAVRIGSTCYNLGCMEFLYVGRGGPEVEFLRPGEFFFVACPAHTSHATVKIGHEQARTAAIGDGACACARSIRQYIAPGIVPSCQLVMGYTELSPGSVWNTFPSHTHERRSEIYLYSGLGENLVFHVMGQPGETRHLVVRDRQAVLSPPWSIHTGVGTGSYRFVWAMAGENQDFGDIDPVATRDLR